MAISAARPTDTRLRVLQLGPLYTNHLRRWSEHAAELGCEVWAAGHLREGRRPADLRGLALGVEVLPEGADRERWLHELLGRVRPDLVQAHFLPGWPHTAVRVARVPVLATPWGSDLYLATGDDRKRADHVLAGADRVIARSPHMRRALIDRGVPEAKLAAVDLGVDLDRFRPTARALERPVILSFRAGTELYNLDVAIEAFARVRDRRPEAELEMVHGDAPLAPGVRALLPRAGVRSAGRVGHHEMPRRYRAAAVGVSIPGSDGSPSSVWEALACGLPLVLSDLPALREPLEGCAAVRFVRPEPADVAAAMLDLLASDREALSRAARGWAVANSDQREQRARLGPLYRAMSVSSVGSRSGAGGDPTSVR